MSRDDRTRPSDEDPRHNVGVGTDGSLDSTDEIEDDLVEPAGPGVGTDGSLHHTPDPEVDER